MDAQLPAGGGVNLLGKYLRQPLRWEKSLNQQNAYRAEQNQNACRNQQFAPQRAGGGQVQIMPPLIEMTCPEI